MTRRKRHPDKDIEAAIAYAEGAGWKFVPSGKSAHAFGKLRCPNNDQNCRDGIFCINSIWSTPRDPVAHARDIRRLVDHCLHSKGHDAS